MNGFAHVSVWGVLIGALAALVIGAVWYSGALYGGAWQSIMGLSDSAMAKRARSAFPLLIVVSLLTAYVLSLFIVYFHHYVGGSWVRDGFYVGLLSFVGLAGTTVVGHAAFDPRDRKLVLINLGNRLVTLAALGLIIGAFLK